MRAAGLGSQPRTATRHSFGRAVGRGIVLLLLASCAFVAASAQQVQLQPRSPGPTPTLPLQRRQGTETEMATTTFELPTAAISVDGQPSPTSAYGHDPLLALMPDFAFSMPAQITVNGINLALVAVLVTHLLFTVQYHFPLSRRNFFLQISSSIMLLVSLSVTLHIILSQLEAKSQDWPFMFPYIGVQVPPGDESWTTVQEVFYLLMRAITTLLIHVTHIQFLTLLFPSALEARLILWMLGPLAIVNSGMEFTALSSDDDFKTSDLGDAIRNICNSTLTLLYTSALLIWGTLVNRRRAWRAGGGTAAFGGGSVGLAVINTVISFIEIKYDRLWWLPNVCWTLTIWQSWLGFWWWVSSGMGIGEVEDRQERLEKKRKRELRRRRKAERQRRKAAGMLIDDEDGDGGRGGRTGRSGGAAANEAHEGSNGDGASSIPGFNGIRRLKDRMIGDGNGSSAVRRPRRSTAQPGADGGQDLEHIELRQVRIASDVDERSPDLANAGGHHAEGASDLERVAIDEDGAGSTAGDRADDAAEDSRTTAGTGSGSSDTNPTTAASSAPPGWFGLAAQKLMDKQPNFIKARFRRLRLAHVAAARRAATEQSVLREQVLNSSRNVGPGLRHMMFDRADSVRGGIDASAGAARAGSADVSRRNSNIVRSPSTGEAPDVGERSPPSRRTSRGGSRPGGDRSANVGGAVSPEEARLRLTRIASDGPYTASNDTSTTRHSPPTTPSGSGSSLQAAVGADPSDRPRQHPLLHHVGGAETAADDEWVDDDERPAPAPRTGRRAVSPIRRRPDGGHGQIDDEDDDDDENGDDGGAASSWFWRGGLRQMRLRDRTRYD
ncbi:uncharacterized protein PFL1_00294 [Pseudozyma flocculosa PF-1]|uniref:Uncharacterized protein n=1 Tax=Pseudozyma flocculosa TaxID=84751 RepID=A0A5C3ESB2_9BASI|nr:uncharacterized protein PFL1_00294 [Pseudozyma flocculosa PF-1]EPQ32097.1 hypothetical protein PFL1_00294 [Pseudozyma flocculosa PF-1]SPO34972.1 uncharacterized protein PSFLO_00443 [Pseudozyma flocculosa]